MRSIEKTGKKPEDAINAGLKELGCDLSDVTIDILDAGSPGLFGMFGRLAKVRLTVKEDDDFNFDLDFSAPKAEPVKAEPSRPAPTKAPKAPRSEKTERVEKAPRVEKAERNAKVETPTPAPQVEDIHDEEVQDEPVRTAPARHTRPRGERRAAAPAVEPAVTVEPFEATDPATLSGEALMAYDFIKNMTEKMGVNVQISVRQDEDHLNVAMMGDTLGILIGRRGETLDALQYLTSLIVNKKRDQYLRVSLDTENYRAKREEALSRLAQRMAARARKTGRKVTLEPMNPYERRVLHSTLQNNPYVTTHSEGEEPYRRVIITLKDGTNDD